MKPLYLILTITLIISPLPRLSAQYDRIWQFLPRQVATVNQQLITKSRLLEVMLKLKPLKKYQLMRDSELKDNTRLVLKSMINRLLLEQLFKQYGIKVAKGEIRQRLKAMILKMTPFQKSLFARKLRENKQTMKQYITTAENDPDTIFDLKLRKLIEKKYPGKLTVPDERCEEYYRVRQNAFRTPPGVVVTRIVISPEQFTAKLKKQHPSLSKNAVADRTRSMAKTAASAIYEKLIHKKDDFIKLARRYGATGSGSPGTVFRDGTLGAAESLVFSMGPGRITPVIPYEKGWQIIRVNSRIPASYTPFTEVKGLIREELESKRISKFSVALVMHARRTSKIIIYF